MGSVDLYQIVTKYEREIKKKLCQQLTMVGEFYASDSNVVKFGNLSNDNHNEWELTNINYWPNGFGH